MRSKAEALLFEYLSELVILVMRLQFVGGLLPGELYGCTQAGANFAHDLIHAGWSKEQVVALADEFENGDRNMHDFVTDFYKDETKYSWLTSPKEAGSNA